MEAVPWLCFAGTEIVNSNRTMSYLARGLGGPSFSVSRTGTEDAGYTDIYHDIYGADAPLSATLACYCEAMDDGTAFRSPADDSAPWYSSARPESGDFLGMVTDTLRVENPPLRAVAPLAHGGLVGTLTRRSRLIVAHGFMYAASAEGMAWGERWLTEALGGSICEGCGGDEATILPACPDTGASSGEQADAFRTLYDVGVVDGPIFTPMAGIAGCVMQEVSFQLAAGNPYLHHPPISSSTTATSGETLSELVQTTEWGGDAAISITIGAFTDVADVHIAASPVLDIDDCPLAEPNPCAEYSVTSLPRGHILTVDAIRRQVTEYNDSLKADQSGYRRLSFDGPFNWIEVPPCSLMCISVRLGSGTAAVTMASAVREI